MPRIIDTTQTRVIDPRAAAMFAAAYAADYFSWDETDPDRRGCALAGYLPGLTVDAAYLGWAGVGRQRADFALPGRTHADRSAGVLVDVRVRITPYRRADPPTGAPASRSRPEHPPLTGTVVAAAPSPTTRGWRALPARWVQTTVPVVALVDGQLAVDVWDEALDLATTD